MSALESVVDRDAHRRSVRLAVAAREYPRTLILGGIVLLAFRAVTVVLTQLLDPARQNAGENISYLAMAGVLFAVGFLLRGDAVPIHLRPWAFALAAILMGLGLYATVIFVRDPLSYAIILLLLCACGAATLAWLPFCTEVGVIAAAGLVVLDRWPIGPTMNWFMLTLGAGAVGAILLNVRLRTVYELADATAAVQRLAVTDQLTGLLNRHGLMERLPALWSAAGRIDEAVFVVFVDIRGLKQANDRYGHDFGDRAIQAAARAVRNSMRAHDLVARWGGDEIVVIGMGRLPEAEAFDERLQAQHEWTGEDRAKWAGELSVGFAEGRTSIDSVDELIRRADEDMYRRRQSH
jgi:diguanylate cyclase (GGDEF)-like protein